MKGMVLGNTRFAQRLLACVGESVAAPARAELAVGTLAVKGSSPRRPASAALWEPQSEFKSPVILFHAFQENHLFLVQFLATQSRSMTSLVTLVSNFWHSPFHFSSDHKAELSVLAALSLVTVFALVQSRCSPMSRVAMALGLLGIYCYRASVGHVLLPWQRGSTAISR